MVESSFDKQNLMNDDPLEFILLMAGYKHWKYFHKVRGFIFVIVFYLEIFNFICIMDIILYKNFTYLQYLPVLFLQQPGCFGLLIVSVYSKDVFQYQEIVLSNFRSISSGGKKTENRILRESKIIILICILNFGISVVAHLSFIPLVGDESRLGFPIMYCAKHFGRWSKLLIFIYYFCHLLSAYGVAFPIFVTAYIVFHVRFQLYLLNVEIRNLSKQDFVEANLPSNKLRGQSIIYRRISVCAKRHADIIKVTKTLLRRVQHVPMLIIAVCGVLSFVSASYFLIFQISPSSNWRMVLVMMTIISIFLTLCIWGQKITDESNQFFRTLCNTPWYHWNRRSKLALGMILANSLKPLRVSCFGIADLNYAFVLLAVRTIYSLLAVSSKFK